MYRIGEGYDVHKLEKNRDLILGGVKIPYEKGLLGHSDADVLIHAIIDAMFGALSLGDIGKHFPDTDDKYKDISSIILLKEAARIISENCGESFDKSLCNIDSTIICQSPKLHNYIDEMRKNIAIALNVEIKKISIKATTEEGLGFTGAGLGIAVKAICLINVKE